LAQQAAAWVTTSLTAELESELKVGVIRTTLFQFIQVYYYYKIFSVIIDWDYWRNKDPLLPEDALIWFTDGSRANSGTGLVFLA